MERDPVLSFNERLKLVASFYNALGIGLVIGGIFRPAAAGYDIPIKSIALWVFGGLAFHAFGVYILHYLKKGVTK